MALTTGLRFGTYDILGPLGVGGMGEVYRAYDTRLNRDVALKVLPDAFRVDADYLTRFTREAHVLASLNHPNIAVIHGVEESNGTQALVLELVEGPTLADRIARGALPLDEAVPIASQIAHALEAAHERGVIHRDLKPANIKVRDDGTVKVLDFGLAKVLDPQSHTPQEVLTNSPTVALPTVAGVVLGTAAYMSPEQARGKTVDRRADIWAFGCVLFEMLTGKRAFPGDDVSETLANVLKSEPDWQALPPDTPASLRRVLKRCLTKNAQHREPHIGSARLDLQEAGDPQKHEPPRSDSHVRGWIVAITSVAVIGLATSALLFWQLRGSSSDRVVEASRRYQASVLLPEGVRFPPQTVPSWRLGLSPDGTRLAFVGSGSDGVARLYVRPLDAAVAQPLTGTETATAPFWSPDGRFIGYFGGGPAAGKLMKVPINGGLPTPIFDFSYPVFGAHWTSTGDILFSSGGPAPRASIRRVSSAGGTPSVVLSPAQPEGDEAYWWPSLLPDGEHVLYLALANGRPIGLYVVSLKTQQKKRLMTGGSNARFANGALLFLRDQTLFAQSLDLQRLELVGDPSPIVEGVLVGGAAGVTGAFTVSNNGTLAYVASPTARQSQLTWFDRQGQQLTTVGEPGDYGDPALSPDGKRLAVNLPASDQGTRDVWVIDVETARRARLTFDIADDRQSIWSPDGSRIMFNSNRKGVFDLYEKAASGAGAERLVFADAANKIPLGWSPDGRHVLFQRLSPTDFWDVWVLPLFGEGKPYPLVTTPANDGGAQFSPDGRWISYTSEESGPNTVFITAFPGPGGKWQVSSMEGAERGAQPQWRGDGNELTFAARSGELVSAALTAHDGVIQVGEVNPLFRPSVRAFRGNPYAISKDGTRILVNSASRERADSPITILTNWPSLLHR